MSEGERKRGLPLGRNRKSKEESAWDALNTPMPPLKPRPTEAPVTQSIESQTPPQAESSAPLLDEMPVTQKIETLEIQPLEASMPQVTEPLRHQEENSYQEQAEASVTQIDESHMHQLVETLKTQQAEAFLPQGLKTPVIQPVDVLKGQLEEALATQGGDTSMPQLVELARTLPAKAPKTQKGKASKTRYREASQKAKEQNPNALGKKQMSPWVSLDIAIYVEAYCDDMGIDISTLIENYFQDLRRKDPDRELHEGLAARRLTRYLEKRKK